MLNIAITAARNAGRILVQFLDRLDANGSTENERNHFASRVNQLSIQEITRIIDQAYPSHVIRTADESLATDSNEISWIIQPLDGRLNFSHGYPRFSISVAAQIKQRLEVGLVYDPLTHELFTATRGKGAQLNNKRIRVTSCAKLSDALFSADFSTQNSKYPTSSQNALLKFLYRCSGMRQTGSAALDLAYLAAGRLDGLWAMPGSAASLAAGMLLVTEAGGMISDLDGGMKILRSGCIVASTPRLHAPILSSVQDAFKKVC